MTGTKHKRGKAPGTDMPIGCVSLTGSGSLSVLLVDDEPAVLRSTCRMLGSQYKVETAASAEQALVMMGEKRYSLVITDYEMPGKDGLWLLRQARNRYPMMRRGLISGNNRKLISAHLRSGLVDFFLPKPAAYDELVALIARPTCKAALQQLHG